MSPAASGTRPMRGIQTKAPRWTWIAATFFGAGRMNPGSGTWASLFAVLLWSAGAHFLAARWQPLVIALVAAAVLVVGVRAATWVASELGNGDPSCVVIDEVAGQLVALIGVPVHWKSLLAGFILFRLFDILKPPPLRRLERLPEGTGIMMDDVGAGLYALAGVQILLHLRLLQ